MARALRTCRDACRDRYPAVVGKTFPAFPAHAQPAILRIGQEAHGKIVHNEYLMANSSMRDLILENVKRVSNITLKNIQANDVSL